MDNAEAENPREKIGGNEPPDYGKIVADQLAETYRGEWSKIEGLLADAEKLIGSKEKGVEPTYVTDDASMGLFAKIEKSLRDATGRLEAFHKKEKEQFLRGGQSCDRLFFGWWEKCARRNKTDRPGAADILHARIDAYMQAKLAAEQKVRDDAAREAKANEDRLAREKADADRKAADALAAAGRARKAENVEQHHAAAAGHATKAVEIARESEEARGKATETAAAAAAKPADLVGIRVADNVKVTMRTENYCEVTDVGLLPGATLWDFVEDDAKVKAAKNWAKITQYKRELPGAAIGSRPKTVLV